MISSPISARLTMPELLRKLAHMAAFWPALLLPWLSPIQGFTIAVLLIFLNMFILPKMAPLLYRNHEMGRGQLEIILYPFALLATIIAFGFDATHFQNSNTANFRLLATQHWYPPVMAIWFALAFGDALMGIACRLMPTGPRLPWNPRKPLMGVLLGMSALVILVLCLYLLSQTLLPLSPIQSMHFNSDFRTPLFLVLFVILCGLSETIWFGIADNIVIPFSLAIFLSLFPNPLFSNAFFFNPWFKTASSLSGFTFSNPHHHSHFLFWLSVPFIFAWLSYQLKLLTKGGALLGGLLSAIFILTQPMLFFFMAGFFVFGNIATRVGFKQKQIRGIAEARGGRRGAQEVFGAIGMAAWVTPLVYLTFNQPNYFHPALLVCIAPLIAKTMDTVSSEIGKAYAGPTYSLQTFQPVPPGTNGGVSLKGTLAGIISALLLALFILPLGWGNFLEVGILILIAILSNVFESYWKAWAGPRGVNQGAHTNVLMTLMAAALGWLWWFAI